MDTIIVNTKPSHRMCDKFNQLVPNATYLGQSTLGSKSRQYRIPLHIWEEKEAEIKKYATKSKVQY